MSLERTAEVRQALSAIATDPDYGAAALSSTRTLTNLLNDLLPDAPREKSVLAGAAEARLSEILLDRVSHGMDPRIAISQAASALAAATVFPREVCDWVAGELALALGLIRVEDLPRSGPGQPDPGQLIPGQIPGPRWPDPGQIPGPGGKPEETTVSRDGRERGPVQPDHATILPDAGSGDGLARRRRGLDPRRRTGLIVLGGLAAAAVVAAVVIAAQPSPAPPPRHHHHHRSPSLSPAPTPTVEALTTIMNPAGSAALATHCGSAPLQGLDPATLTSKLYCTHATNTHVVVWAYQFDSYSDYQQGVGTLNKSLKFDPAASGKGCPPPAGHSDGYTGWKSTPNYPLRSGQNLECYVSGGGEPVLAWTMPTQNVIFLAEYKVSGASIADIIKWWKHTTYG